MNVCAKEEEREAIVYCSDCLETVRSLKEQGLPVIYLEKAGAEPCYEADWVWQCTNETPLPDEMFLERVWRRTCHLPWRICYTERLLIRESVPEDLDSFLKFYAEESGNTDVGRWSGAPLEQLQNYIDGQYRMFGYGLWTIALRETGEVVGRAGLEQPEKQVLSAVEKGADGTQKIEIIWLGKSGTTTDCLEISWLIGKAYRRRGYAWEAAEAILCYADRELGCGSIIARTSAQNEASLSLARKLRNVCLDKHA